MNSQQLTRIGALGGIISVVLQLGGQMLIQVGGQEPSFNAGTAEITEFFANRDAQLAPVGGFIAGLGFIPFLWFLGVLWSRLRKSEESPGWLSAVALGSGMLIVAVQMAGAAGWMTAFARTGDGIAGDVIRFQFDSGNFLFAASWVMIASLLIATAVVTFLYQALPKWTGWFGLVIAICLLIATANWFTASDMLFIPVMLWWLWLIIVSVILMRKGGRRAIKVE